MSAAVKKPAGRVFFHLAADAVHPSSYFQCYLVDSRQTSVVTHHRLNLCIRNVKVRTFLLTL